jgi:predicted outer membrane repeat protein
VGVLVSVSSVNAADIYVNASAPAGGDGSSTNPFQNISAGIDLATDGDIVNIADGTYTGDSNTGITISKNMSIIGQSQAGTIIDAENNNWIFCIEDSVAVSISKLTLKNSETSDDNYGAIKNNGELTCMDCNFTGNIAERYGGAIYNYEGAVTCENCNFTDNSAGDDGGAIFNEMGEVTCTNSGFTGNSADEGGAIYNGDEGTLTCTNCDFTDNYADEGGAIANLYNQLTCTDCTFTENSADYYGGAIYSYEGVVTCTSCGFTENHAYCGGAIYADEDSVLTCTNCNFENNTATYDGGVFYSSGDEVTVIGSTLINNHAGNEGGVFYNEGNSFIFNFNRIVNNTADGVNDIYDRYSNSEAIRDALYNWWGSNDGPADGSIYGEFVEYDPWLVMTYSADPTTIPQGETSTLTADFRYDSEGTFHDPALGHLPDGLPVTFTTDLGNVGSKSVVTYTLNGVATATLRGDEAAGEASTSANLDDQTLTAPVTIRAAGGDNSGNSSVIVEAATIDMQETGAPSMPLVLAALSILGGLLTIRKKQ